MKTHFRSCRRAKVKSTAKSKVQREKEAKEEAEKMKGKPKVAKPNKIDGGLYELPNTIDKKEKKVKTQTDTGNNPKMCLYHCNCTTKNTSSFTTGAR